MTTMQEREAKRALWLKHWQEWSASAEPFAEYARRHELDDDEGYRWKRILQRAGLLPEHLRRVEGDKVEKPSKPEVVRFARVRIAAESQSSSVSALRLQLQLANGRRVELTLADEVQLPRIVKLLEQPA
jgi:hypothetical protein